MTQSLLLLAVECGAIGLLIGLLFGYRLLGSWRLVFQALAPCVLDAAPGIWRRFLLFLWDYFVVYCLVLVAIAVLGCGLLYVLV